MTHTWLEEDTVWSCVLLSCSQLPGSRGGDWLHVPGHDGHSTRGGQAGGQRERCFAGILRNARGRGQFPVAACRETLKKKQSSFWDFFFFLQIQTCLRKGPTTKLECSTTERASFVLTLSTQTVLPFFSFFPITLSTSDATAWSEITYMMLSDMYWKLAPLWKWYLSYTRVISQ